MGETTPDALLGEKLERRFPPLAQLAAGIQTSGETPRPHWLLRRRLRSPWSLEEISEGGLGIRKEFSLHQVTIPQYYLLPFDWFYGLILKYKYHF